MSKYVVAIGFPVASGSQRVEIGSWINDTVQVAYRDPEISPLIDNLIQIPCQYCPTPCARNQIVKKAKELKADFLYMIDDDCGPPLHFFKTALQFLLAQPEPSVIGCPYVSGGTKGPDEEVPVFSFQNRCNSRQPNFQLEKISREDAARRSGIQEVANIGTHCICYDMRVFNYVEAPYYDYTYNEDHTGVTETEDNYLHRRLFFAQVPIYCDFNSWATHYKVKRLEKPWIVSNADIDELYINQAQANIVQTMKKPDAPSVRCISPNNKVAV